MRTKKKWEVIWWNDSKDKQDKQGFDTYEDAITFLHGVEKKYNRRATIKLR